MRNKMKKERTVCWEFAVINTTILTIWEKIKQKIVVCLNRMDQE